MNLIKILAFLTIFLSLLNSGSLSAQNNCPSATAVLYCDTVDVLHYSIHLTEVNLTSKTIKGYTEVTMVPRIGNLNQIKLELSDLTVDSVIFENAAAEFDHVGKTVITMLPSLAGPGDTLLLTVYYHGVPFVDPSGWGGFLFSGEYAFNLGVGFDAIPHNLGKAWFPCIDDFRDRALYDVFLTVPDPKKGISGGMLSEVCNNGDGTSTWHWTTSFSLPTYLISASIGNYSLVSDIYHGIQRDIPITLYCRPSDSLKVAGTFVNLKDILQIYEEHFGPYPFERVGYTATAQGAMEHAANISYPYSGWSGNTSMEWWYAHELSHMWFGDMVTCASAEDMWLNEGWAVWCESLFQEFLYGPETSRIYMREKLRDVLLYTHTIDGGYYPVYGIPETITYGNTVYEKGGQVTHTLRHYLGDSLFFGGIKAYLQQYAYQPASSCNLRDFLSSYTGVDLNDFFNAWVFAPGFPHFAVSSFQSQAEGQGYKVVVNVKQKMLGTDTYSNSNHLELTFRGKGWEQFTDTLIFSGAESQKTFYVPFEPVAVMADASEKISDASIDYTVVARSTGDLEFPDTYSKLKVIRISDSALVRIIHNWVGPDSLKTPVPALKLSDKRYWKVEGIFPADFKASVRFSYNRASLDNTLLTSSNDSLVILFRPDATFDWQAVPFTRSGNNNAGAILVDSIARGEYTLAAWDRTYGLGENAGFKPYNLDLFPNPSGGNCTVRINAPCDVILGIYDTIGRELDKRSVSTGIHEVRWSDPDVGKGIYFFRLMTATGNVLASRKAIFR